MEGVGFVSGGVGLVSGGAKSMKWRGGVTEARDKVVE